MTNFEKYKDDIIEFLLTTGHSSFGVDCHNRLVGCNELSCSNCKFKSHDYVCRDRKKEWLNAEYTTGDEWVDVKFFDTALTPNITVEPIVDYTCYNYLNDELKVFYNDSGAFAHVECRMKNLKVACLKLITFVENRNLDYIKKLEYRNSKYDKMLTEGSLLPKEAFLHD